MMKNKILLADFEHLVHLIRNQVKLTPEEKELWEQSLKKIEYEIDKNPTVKDIDIRSKGYELVKVKEDMFEPWWKRLINKWF